jgi:hypothetical protein
VRASVARAFEQQCAVYELILDPAALETSVVVGSHCRHACCVKNRDIGFEKLRHNPDAGRLADARTAADDRDQTRQRRAIATALIYLEDQAVDLLRATDGILELVGLEQG